MTRCQLTPVPAAPLLLLVIAGPALALASCATTSSTEGPTPPVRVIWHDFEQKRRQDAAGTGAKRVGIHEMVLVTATFDGGSYVDALEQGRLPPTVKVVDREVMSELLASLRDQGFFTHAQKISLPSLSGDEMVRAAITIERAGEPDATVILGRGAGSSAGVGAVVQTFLACKDLVRRAYNKTVQYGRVSVIRETP